MNTQLMQPAQLAVTQVSCSQNTLHSELPRQCYNHSTWISLWSYSTNDRTIHFWQALAAANLSKPRIPVYSNVTGEAMHRDEIARSTAEQICNRVCQTIKIVQTLSALVVKLWSNDASEVRLAAAVTRVLPICRQLQWELVMTNLIRGGWTKLTELGPGVALRSACRHTNQDIASKSFINIEVWIRDLIYWTGVFHSVTVGCCY